MGKKPISDEILATVAKNRIQEGRWVLISLAHSRPMVVSVGMEDGQDWIECLIALYEKLGQDIPETVVQKLKDAFVVAEDVKPANP
jgi:hypothetical protein